MNPLIKKNSGIRNSISKELNEDVYSELYIPKPNIRIWLYTTSIIVNPLIASIYSIRFVMLLFVKSYSLIIQPSTVPLSDEKLTPTL